LVPPGRGIVLPEKAFNRKVREKRPQSTRRKADASATEVTSSSATISSTEPRSTAKNGRKGREGMAAKGAKRSLAHNGQPTMAEETSRFVRRLQF